MTQIGRLGRRALFVKVNKDNLAPDTLHEQGVGGGRSHIARTNDADFHRGYLRGLSVVLTGLPRAGQALLAMVSLAGTREAVNQFVTKRPAISS